jgi:hypothetical protein
VELERVPVERWNPDELLSIWSLLLYIGRRVHLPRVSVAGVWLPPDVATGKPGVLALLYRGVYLWESVGGFAANGCPGVSDMFTMFLQ